MVYIITLCVTSQIKRRSHKFSQKNDTIRNIALNIGKDIIDNNYGAISSLDKNAEIWYYLVKWRIYSYTLQYYHIMGIYAINYGQFMCHSVYLNSFAYIKQWYTPYEKIYETHCQVEY